MRYGCIEKNPAQKPAIPIAVFNEAGSFFPEPERQPAFRFEYL
jgi:hypothetical protein